MFGAGQFQPNMLGYDVGDVWIQTYKDQQCQKDTFSIQGHCKWKPEPRPNYRGICTNVNARPDGVAPDPSRLYDPEFYKAQYDPNPEDYETWQTLKFVGVNTKLCVYRGFNCRGEYYEIPGQQYSGKVYNVYSAPCRALALDDPSWDLVSYYIMPSTASCSNFDHKAPLNVLFSDTE